MPAISLSGLRVRAAHHFQLNYFFYFGGGSSEEEYFTHSEAA
jgi:hypothetical protein